MAHIPVKEMYLLCSLLLHFNLKPLIKIQLNIYVCVDNWLTFSVRLMDKCMDKIWTPFLLYCVDILTTFGWHSVTSSGKSRPNT